MKVKPYIKHQPMKKNEVRIITIDENAIEEFLLENLMDNKSKYFNVPTVSNNTTCIMKWDKNHCMLTYAIIPIEYCLDGYDLNSEFILKIGTTTKSLLNSNRYKTFVLTDEMLTKTTNEDKGTRSTD